LPFRIKLPQVGESVTEAVIGRWLRKPGDHIEKFDPLVEIVTDKVSMEFPAPHAGTLTRIIYADGAEVPMGTVIAEMDLDDPSVDTGDEAEAQPADAPDSSPEEVGRVGRMVSGANVGPTGGVFADATRNVARQDAEPAQPAQAARPDRGDLSARFSPVVVRLAAQHGVDLSRIAGTGIGGRVTKQDVIDASRRGAATTGGEAAEATHVAAREPGPGESAAPGDRTVEPSPVRRMIAARMVRSATEIPHAWTAIEVDVTNMVLAREGKKAAFATRHKAELSYVAFTLHAIARALRSNPLVNSSWQDGKILVRGAVNVGIAVAAPHGLVVPVIRDTDKLTIAGIARATAPLVERARANRLTPADVQDGTFTLNNTGALGSVLGMAIINHPQAAIMNTEAIVKRPVVVSGSGGDQIVVRSMMNVTLSFDHRVIDGAEASRFVQDVRRNIEGYAPSMDIGD